MILAILAAVALAAAAPLTVMAQQPAGEPALQVAFEETEAIPGQPLSLRLTILVPTFMPSPPVWPNLEALNLLVRLPERSTGPTSARIGGENWAGITRHYRISPVVQGNFVIPPQTITVTYADPQTNEPVEATLGIEPLEFSGVVPEDAAALDPFIAAAAVELKQTIKGDPEAMVPGDSVIWTVTAQIRGTSPMFLPDLLPPIAAEGIAAYADEPVLSETEDRGGLGGTRSERVTLIAEGGGRGEAPPVTLDWYNLDTEEIETATLEGFSLVIDGPPASAGTPRDWRGIGITGSILALGVLLVLALARRFLPPLGRWINARYTDWRASERYAYARLRRVVDRRDHAALRPALDDWAGRIDGGDPRGDPELNRALIELGATRYGRVVAEDAQAPWRALEAALSQARRASRAYSTVDASLPPLNPQA